MSTEKFIYKILPQNAWQESLGQETLPWLDADKADGFIHFSTHAQLIKTLNKHFAGQKGLMLLEIAVPDLPQTVAAHLKWEKNRPGGDAYPHLYTDLPRGCVKNTYTILLSHDGEFDIPGLPR